jgi:hypothetical protein
VPQALRAAGFRVQTLAERYGIPQDQNITDVQWLREATADGFVVVMKDDAIRRNKAEREMVDAEGVRGFCITNMQLTGPVMAQMIIDNGAGMARVCRKPGPFIDGIYRNELRLLHPRTPPAGSRPA